ncbi:exodeoxyribonuclease V subunit gamma [Acidothermaceae bacterium B102]|nr:exodeoxyribonuclease V subunit gamma [Acidothermaceae bacterium B102]
MKLSRRNVSADLLRRGTRLLTIHHAKSGALLVKAVGDAFIVVRVDPLASEVVAVPAKGVERWLAQRLAHVLGATGSDGVCANVRFPSPNRLLDDTAEAVSPEHALSVERWAPATATWPLLAVIDTSGDEPWCGPLTQHLGEDGGDKGRRLAVATRVARLFDAYGQSRPQMLQAWSAGLDEVGDGSPLPNDLRWQAALWRALRAHLGTPSPAELLDDTYAQLRAHPELSPLPQRLSVFGATRISPARLRILVALAEHRDVHLWLHHPSPALWAAAANAPLVTRRKDDTTRSTLRNPLLASMSRDLLELQLLLRKHAPNAQDIHHPSEPQPDTLLGHLKQDLADDAVRQDPPALDARDRSIQVHACHGRTREVEVLREVILGLLEQDPSLEPRDVLVMCPDVETFAPLIAAAFSLGSEDNAPHPAARLRVRIADRSLRQTNSLLEVLSHLLELGTARVTASEVLDLAGRTAVRQRFGFDDDELDRLRGWVAGSGIRWGLDSDHRTTWQMSGVAQGTWRAGLDRLLLGVAMEGDEIGLNGVVPVDDVDSADIDLLGRLAELVDRLHALQRLYQGQHTAKEWMDGLKDAVLSLCATTNDNAWQHLQLADELADVAEAAADSTVKVGLADIRALLASALAGRPTRSSFRTGTLTVCTLVPMRSVPHRVVCLLGLDDGTFPRQSVRDGDDVLARDPWIGERDPRSEDRQLLLDAVCAAEDHLVIIYSGADDRTGAAIPPAVPLGELLDAFDRTATVPGGGRVRDAITTHHPLQPFDARNFTAAALGTPGPFSFDRLALAGAQAAGHPRTASQAFLTTALAPVPNKDVELADLQRLLANPARQFLRQRLNVDNAWAEGEPDDALPVELDALERWGVQDRMLSARITGVDRNTAIAAERARGQLPPGRLGVTVLQDIDAKVDALLAATVTQREREPESYDIDLGLGDGTRLTGTVAGGRGDLLLTLTPSSLSAKHRLAAWIDLVALTAAHPSRDWRALTVGRDAWSSTLGPISEDTAQAVVRDLVALFRSGLQAPLPLPVKTAAEYAGRRDKGDDPGDALIGADKHWADATYPGEQSDAAHVLIHGGKVDLTVLTAAPGVGEPHLFGQVARRLWQPLLDAETQGRL